MSRHSFRKVNPPVGARPGTLALPAGSPPPEIRVVRYSPDVLEEKEVGDVEELAGLDLSDGLKTWVDVRGLGDEAVLRRIQAIFDIHPLALEDAVNVPQRAKSEIYEGHHLLVGRLPLRDDEGTIVAPQVCLLIGEGCLLTFQERYFAFFEPVRARLRRGGGPIRECGPDYLAYALLDCLIDRYYPLAQELSDRAEDLEDEVAEEPDSDILRRVHQLRRDLVVVRRVGWPQREAIVSLIEESSPFVRDETRAFLRDVSDHIAQIMELVDSSHDMAVGLVELYISQVSHRTNEIMKVLTLMASIFIPLTFIAGVYGMNFEYMPELGRPIGYPAVLVVMGIVAIVMLVYFRARGWIGPLFRRRRKRRRERDW